jgi:hypothetical protein
MAPAVGVVLRLRNFLLFGRGVPEVAVIDVGSGIDVNREVGFRFFDRRSGLPVPGHSSLI